jgi:hypothetical protein
VQERLPLHRQVLLKMEERDRVQDQVVLKVEVRVQVQRLLKPPELPRPQQRGLLQSFTM